jgi:deazaflavin-dependent oxidoreductase (nitroreductase family)
LAGAQDSTPHAALADLLDGLSRPRAPGVLLGRLLALGAPGRLLARLARSPMRARGITTGITRLHARLLRLSRGRLRRSWLFAAGQPVIALTTVGRRSGATRTTAVAALPHRDALATVGMNLGMERDPGWCHNLTANPDAWITIAGVTIPVRARRATGGEWEELWHRWVDVQPSAATFAQIARRQVPIFVLDARSEP